MAADFLNLYDVFVLSVFGSIFASWLGILLIIVLIGWFSKMSELLVFALVGLWTMLFFIFYLGAPFISIIFAVSLLWFVFSVINLIMSRIGRV